LFAVAVVFVVLVTIASTICGTFNTIFVGFAAVFIGIVGRVGRSGISMV
jgi:hypothetical protein